MFKAVSISPADLNDRNIHPVLLLSSSRCFHSGISLGYATARYSGFINEL